MRKIWLGIMGVFCILTLAGCGCTGNQRGEAGQVMSVTVNDVPILSYRTDGKVVLPVEDLADCGFYVYRDNDAGILFANRGAEITARKKGKAYLTEEIKGDPIAAKERVFVNGKELETYAVNGQVCVPAQVLGDTVNSDFSKQGISDYYLTAAFDGRTGELSLGTDLKGLPSREEILKAQKQEDIFPQEIAYELEGEDFTLLVKNIYPNRYRVQTKIQEIDRDGRMVSFSNYFAAYQLSEPGDFRIEGDKIFFYAKYKGEYRSFSYDIKTSAIVQEGSPPENTQRIANIAGDVLWSQQTPYGVVCVVQEGQTERIKIFRPEGGVAELSRAVTQGKGFSKIMDCKITGDILSFTGQDASGAAAYSVDISDGGFLSGDIVAGSLPVIMDGVVIQGYSVAGQDAICVQDLVNCGYTVETENGVVLVKEAETLENPVDMPLLPPGTPVGNAKITGGRVRLNGMSVPFYEADGRQYLLLKELCAFRTDYNEQWGYSDYNMRAEYADDAIRIALFRLGPAMDGEFERLDAMVSKEEIELYTQGTEEEAPYFGARLEPESGIYAGITGDNLIPEGKISCLLNYVEFDDFQTDFYLPNRHYVRNMDCICVVPWNITDLSLVFENDAYIRRMLDNLASYDKPMIIRFGAEMNISGIGDSPSAFVNAFRKIAGMIHEAYPQFAVMWSMNDLGALNKPSHYYYPGDEYVDWMGISSFMKKHFGGVVDLDRDGNVFFMTGDFAYHTNTVQNILSFMEENGIKKPVAVSEGGTATALYYEGGGEVREWSDSRMRSMYWYLPMRYPQVKIIDYFNHDTPNESQSYDLTFHPYLRKIFDEATNSGAYLSRYGDKPEFTFVKAQGRTFMGQSIPLYGYVYIPEEEVSEVSYWLDDAVVAQCTQIPYDCSLDARTIAEGMHKLTMKITASGGERIREYQLIKNADGSIIIQ